MQDKLRVWFYHIQTITIYKVEKQQYSTEECTQYLIINYNGTEPEKEHTHV